MTDSIKKTQMLDWLNRIQKRMKTYEDEINTMTEDDVDILIDKLRNYYSLIALLGGVYSGKVILQGIDHDRLKKQD